MVCAWRRLLAPWSLCAACAVYEPSLISGTRKDPPAKGSTTAADAGSDARGSGGSLLIGSGGASTAPAEQGGEGGSGELAAGEAGAAAASAGAAGDGAGPISSGGTSSGGGSVVVPGGSGSGGTAELDLDLIDDFETADVYGLYLSGRKPLWYLMDDGTAGTQQPLPLEMTPVSADQAAVSGSTAALLVSCSGFSGWGSGVGVDLLNASGKQPYDLSAYAGIAFWAKVPGSYRLVRVNLPDQGTDPSGQLCGAGCNDHFGKSLVLTAEWQRHEILFSDLAQVGWGLQRQELTREAVYSIHFQVAATKQVELWIDDLSLLVK